jgi:hypothetical protein
MAGSGLKLGRPAADLSCMPVDMTLLDYWKRQQAARARARAALPDRWVEDTRPEMHAVTDAYVELLTRIKQPTLSVLTSEDR